MFEFLDIFRLDLLEMLLPQGSEFAKDIDLLFDITTILVGFWFFLTLGFFFYLMFRFREKKVEKAQYVSGETHSQKMAVEVPHYLILVCDVVILVLTFIVWYDVKIDLPPADREIGVEGRQWSWVFHYPGEDGELWTEDDIRETNKLHLENGATYRFHLRSRDVMHSFSIPIFRLKQDVIPGRTISGHFTPIITGEYDIQCAEMCGVAHGLMMARVIIKTPEEYSAWLEGHGIKENATENLATNSKELEDKNHG